MFFNILESGIGSSVEPNFGWFVFCGAIWGLSMVVPGLSSSSILLFMGLYQPMAAGIGNLNMSVLVPMMIGFIITVAVSARIMNRLIENHYCILSKIIIGFVISSVLMIVPTSFTGTGQLLAAAAFFAAGFAAARLMDVKRQEN